MKKKGAGIICCVSSGSCMIASDPLYSAYAATKATSEAFCRSLRAELRKSDIVVQCHTPLFVTTKISKIKRANFTTPTPERYAKDAVAALEKGNRTPSSTVSPYSVHRFLLAVMNAFPTQVVER
eukprot:GHVU01053187.1.p1 GENE.GHVU01053187.1~~GHVU01053187.1.p1  ORF type:complete len:124 (+),score=14.81 GHVU01053187.1:1522-1893(+)